MASHFYVWLPKPLPCLSATRLVDHAEDGEQEKRSGDAACKLPDKFLFFGQVLRRIAQDRISTDSHIVQIPFPNLGKTLGKPQIQGITRLKVFQRRLEIGGAFDVEKLLPVLDAGIDDQFILEKVEFVKLPESR